MDRSRIKDLGFCHSILLGVVACCALGELFSYGQPLSLGLFRLEGTFSNADHQRDDRSFSIHCIRLIEITSAAP